MALQKTTEKKLSEIFNFLMNEGEHDVAKLVTEILRAECKVKRGTKFSMLDFADKTGRRLYEGVFYDNGSQVATDGRQIMVFKEEYDPELEGKIIDKNGDFSHISGNKDRKNGPLYPLKADYAAYYEANQENMYQVFCFGPVLVDNYQALSIPSNYTLGEVKDHYPRAGIAKMSGELHYLMVAANGEYPYTSAVTIAEFQKQMMNRLFHEERVCV